MIMGGSVYHRSVSSHLAHHFLYMSFILTSRFFGVQHPIFEIKTKKYLHFSKPLQPSLPCDFEIFLGFFSSSFRKIHHPWRPQSLPQYSSPPPSSSPIPTDPTRHHSTHIDLLLRGDVAQGLPQGVLGRALQRPVGRLLHLRKGCFELKSRKIFQDFGLPNER